MTFQSWFDRMAQWPATRIVIRLCFLWWWDWGEGGACVCARACVCPRACICMHVHARARWRVRVLACVCLRAHVCMHVLACVRACVRWLAHAASADRALLCCTGPCPQVPAPGGCLCGALLLATGPGQRKVGEMLQGSECAFRVWRGSLALPPAGTGDTRVL